MSEIDDNYWCKKHQPSIFSKFVIIESPFAGDVVANLGYLKECVRDSINRGETPFASHGFYTHFLDDNIPEDRKLGINLGFNIGKKADYIAVYTDRGVSNGMLKAVEHYARNSKTIKYRSIFDKEDNEKT